MTLVFTLVVPNPTRPVSMNERLHWAQKRKREGPWKDSATWLARSAKRQAGFKQIKGVPCVVRTIVGIPDRRRRDPHNYMPVTKLLVDVLVKEGYWPDDNPDWLTVMAPELHVSSDTIVEVWPRDP